MGPHAVLSYVDGFDSPAFAAATIWYPDNSERELAGVAIAPGWVEEEGVFHGWGRFLASHGFVAITFSMNNSLTDPPDLRATALLAAVDLLQAEGVRSGSPLNGRMSRGGSARYALIGHSMGGGGSLVAARTSRADIKAIIPLTPWYSPPDTNFNTVQKPTLILAGENDTIAGPTTHAYNFYVDISAPPKIYAEFANGSHFVVSDPVFDDPNGLDLHEITARMGLSWLKLYVDNDTRYKPFLVSSPAFSKYETARF